MYNVDGQCERNYEAGTKHHIGSTKDIFDAPRNHSLWSFMTANA